MSYIMHLDDGRMTADEFLEWHQYQEERYELIAGIPVRMMAGAKQGHAVMVANIIIAAGAAMRDRGCRMTASDTAVRVSDHRIRYPDVVVDCAPPAVDTLEAAEPTLIVEVSSPSTREFDGIDKLEEYQGLRSVRYILLLDPEVVDAKLYTRTDGGWDVARYDRLNALIPLPILGAELALADVYATLNPADPPRLQLLDKA